MAKDRLVVCENYVCEHNCKKGKDATFYGECQHCHSYRAVRGAKPAKVDHRKKDLEKVRRKEVD